jgi:regulator of protease activity HflC (stomatin/prohibitin superfamily)
MPIGVLFLGFAVFLFLVMIIVLSAVKIVPEYKRGVVFRLGLKPDIRNFSPHHSLCSAR